jgi:hypothetical protein
MKSHCVSAQIKGENARSEQEVGIRKRTLMHGTESTFRLQFVAKVSGKTSVKPQVDGRRRASILESGPKNVEYR